jgi:hypothetical protein
VAGLVSFAFGEYAPTLVPPSLEFSPEQRADRNSLPVETERRMRGSRDLGAALAYGGLGGLLGLTLGVAGGLARRSSRGAIAAGLTGLVLGEALGLATTLLLLRWYHASRIALTDENHNQDLGLALATHGGIWLAIGAAAGAALGLGLGGGRLVRGIIGGILGAAIATVIYEFGGAIMFPLAETFRPTAGTAPARLLAHLSVALCVSTFALWAALHLSLRRGPAKRPVEN